jgi:hypothetical protein
MIDCWGWSKLPWNEDEHREARHHFTRSSKEGAGHDELERGQYIGTVIAAMVTEVHSREVGQQESTKGPSIVVSKLFSLT